MGNRFSRLDIKHRIDRMIETGVPFSNIEDFIDTLPLSSETKAAIWLYTWSQQPQNVRDEIVLVFLL